MKMSPFEVIEKAPDQIDLDLSSPDEDWLSKASNILEGSFEIKEMRESGKWHEEVAVQKAESDYLRTYGVEYNQILDYAGLPLQSEFNGYTFKALNTPEKICVEGVRMHHCVSSYVSSVIEGKCYLYTIEKNGKRTATMQIVQRAGTWECVQIKGPCNQRVSSAVIKARNLFIMHLNKKHKQKEYGLKSQLRKIATIHYAGKDRHTMEQAQEQVE